MGTFWKNGNFRYLAFDLFLFAALCCCFHLYDLRSSFLFVILGKMASQSTVSTSLSEFPSLPSNVTTEVYQWVHPTVIQSSSRYDTPKKVRDFVAESGLKGVGQYFDLVPCLPHERVCDRAAEEEPDYFFVYDTFFTRLPLQLPLSSFVCNVLSALQIASTQLLPNGWAFVYAFECLCRYLF